MPVINGKRFMTSSDTPIHGTYINDYKRWKHVRKIGHQEAYAKCKDLVPPEIKAEQYLWHNKGFIVLDLIEMTLQYMKAKPTEYGYYDYLQHLQAGMYAVYLADGNYYLYEYTESV